jgi:hypothetical protein
VQREEGEGVWGQQRKQVANGGQCWAARWEGVVPAGSRIRHTPPTFKRFGG